MIPAGWRPVYDFKAVEWGDCALVPEGRPQPIEPRFATLERIQGRVIVRRVAKIPIWTPRTGLLGMRERPLLWSPSQVWGG